MWGDGMNIGLIGFGSMGRTHSFAIANLPFFYKDLPFQAHITGVCTKNPEHAREAAAAFGLGRAASEEELISDPSIDVIDICTPNVYHYETILKALRAGKHIYCEKPLCVTEEQAAEVSHLANERGVTAGIVFNNRFLLPVMRAKEWIDAGRLGTILSFRGAYYHSSVADIAKRAGWKQNRDICGGGVLFDLGSHVIDLIYYLCGSFDEVFGMGRIVYPVRTGMDGREWKTNADEAFYMTARLANGALGTIETGKIFNGANDDLSFEIYGTEGSLRFSLMEPNWLYVYDKNEAQTGYQRVECCGRYPAPGGIFPGVKAPIGWLRGHIGSMYNFLNAVHTGCGVTPSFADGAHIQAIMAAAYRSDASGKMEKVAPHE